MRRALQFVEVQSKGTEYLLSNMRVSRTLGREYEPLLARRNGSCFALAPAEHAPPHRQSLFAEGGLGLWERSDYVSMRNANSVLPDLRVQDLVLTACLESILTERIGMVVFEDPDASPSEPGWTLDPGYREFIFFAGPDIVTIASSLDRQLARNIHKSARFAIEPYAGFMFTYRDPDELRNAKESLTSPEVDLLRWSKIHWTHVTMVITSAYDGESWLVWVDDDFRLDWTSAVGRVGLPLVKDGAW